MEHRCYQCGAAVEDGTAFCGHCTAPQIRVVVTADSMPLSETVPEIVAERTSYSQLPMHPKGQWAQALPAAFVGMLIATALATIIPGALGLGLLATGFLSVYFYRRRNPFAQLTIKLGARLGALSGVLGFGITAIASATAAAVLHSGGQLHALMLKAAEQYVSRSTDPQMQQVLDFYASPQGFILMLVIGSIMMLLLFMALSSMGGMIGAAVLRKKDSI
ncbi:MAG: hypothetical protein ACHP8A_04225 [Terriglobales bacterium]